jgi:UDP-glucose 4-epimerase
MTLASTGCDAVLHLAAAADVGEVQKDPSSSEQLNARGTAIVLEAARRADVGRVVYASTIWVYSDVVAEHVDEDTPLAPPAHLYTATKLAGELYCRSYRELYDVDSTILRFGIPYGPRARPGAVVPIFVNKALAGEPLTIAGGGTQSRRFVYVEDLADGVVRALAPDVANTTINLVGEEDTTIRDIADRVRDVVGNVDIVEVEGRAGDFKGAEVSGKRAAELLDWRAETPFAEGLARYVAWHREDAAARALREAAEQAAAAEAATSEPVPVLASAGTAPEPVGAAAAGGVVGAVAPAIAAGASIVSFIATSASAAVHGASSSERRRFMLRPLLLLVIGLLAGALVAGLMRADAFTDPLALLVTLGLLAIPTLMIADVDWSRDRRDAALVIATMIAGTALEAFLGWFEVLAHLARGHLRISVAVVLACAAIAAVGMRRRTAARA